MPKKWKGRLEDIANLDNARLAYEKARKSTKHKERKGIIKYSDDKVLSGLCEMILKGEYVPLPAHTFKIVEPFKHKTRLIEAPAFETKVVEQMILNVYGLQICKFIHPNQCGSVPNKGLEHSRKIVRKWSTMSKRNKKYYVQGDIKQFFPSITRNVAMKQYERHIGDTRVIKLIRSLMPHDIGQPLGNALVQATANLVFQPLMHETMKFTKYAIGQMDDFVTLFSNKKLARKYITYIVDFAKNSLGLTIKTKGDDAIQIWQWRKRPIDISGFVTSFRGHQKVRRHVYLALRRFMSCSSMSLKQAMSFMSRMGMVKHTDCVRFYDKLSQYENTHKLRNIISKENVINESIIGYAS